MIDCQTGMLLHCI